MNHVRGTPPVGARLSSPSEPCVLKRQIARGSLTSLMVFTGLYTLAIGGIGVYITKVLTFPVGT